MRYLGNAFSLGMIEYPSVIKVEEVHEIPEDVYSIVGHESTAQVLSAKLGFKVKFNREAIKLNRGDILYVTALFKDGRPFRTAEGQVLSEEELNSIEIRFLKVEVQ